ncbi:MAG: hemerythrin domain-containing protein [Actinomycetes bacterium]
MGPQTDVIDVIVADHRQLESLCERLQTDLHGRDAVLPHLCALLTAHHEAAEGTAIASNVPAGQRCLAAVTEDREEAVDLARQLREVPSDSPAFAGMLSDLADLVTAHGEQEESSVLCCLADLPEAERHALGAAFLRARAAWLAAA